MTPQARMPQLLYWGEPLPADCDLDALARSREPALPHGGLDVAELVSWLPEPGRGFTDSPGLAVRRGRRHLYTQFILQSAKRSHDGWDFELGDAAAGLGLSLRLGLHADSGVFSADCRLTNLGADELAVDGLATMVLPIPRHLTERQSLGGRWAGEFQTTREPMSSAAWVQEARLGRTSHHAFPGLLLMEPGTHATQGEAWSVQMAWSGNHRLVLQRLRLGGAQLQAGELLLPGEVILLPAESHDCPTLHMARSSEGLRRLSLRWHRFIRECVLPAMPAPRPVQFNTWEATYFDHDDRRLTALAKAAAELGVERFVLDDGWFAGRFDDRAGLGDWVPCPKRYPQGLAPLANYCRALGMEFGLWVEPEGVSQASELFRAHPDWVMGVPELDQPLGRHQFVVNLALPAARQHLFAQIAALLRSAPISFLKWDMNRDMTHAAGPDGCATARQHVLGLYSLMDELREAFPSLEIETCASGGARADLGILRRSSRVWVSDCNDPLERQKIQRGFLGFLPPEVMGVHVGDARSHTTGRVSDMPVRTLNALFGHLGIEANVLHLSEEDACHLREAIKVYKAERSWLHAASITPIDHLDPGVSATLAIAADGSRALASAIAVGQPHDAILAPLRVPGLSPNWTYQVSLHPLWWPNPAAGKTATSLQTATPLMLPGRALQTSGLALPILREGSGVLVQIQAIQ
ncbi:alpha-galactosidase [Roseateles toxinivorans]|nr:alpha-galactosidase [Roseateles toxinivorans]